MQSTQSNYNVDSNTKSSNYFKVRFKALIYFELEKTSNKSFELKPLQISPSEIYFKLTVFKLTTHFKHEMIGIWQRFNRNFELSGTSN